MPYDTYINFRQTIYDRGGFSTGDISVTQLNDCIRDAEDYVNYKLRVELMESALAVTINAAGTATLPSDYLEAQFIYLDRAPTRILSKKPAEWIFRNYPDRNATGIPAFVGETNSTFIFGPAPSSTDVVKGTYYAKPASLPGTATINSVFTELPEIYLWAALAQAELMLGRDGRVAWQQKCDEAIARVNGQDKRKKFSGGPISASPG